MSSPGTIGRLNPNEVQALVGGDRGVQLVDVRTPLEFDSEHIEGSHNIPLDELASRGGEIKKERPVVLVCRTGTRAGRAADLLASYGMDVGVLVGGVVEWKKSRLPITIGKKRLSLERQVQLTIGVLLLTSVTAGWTIDNAWFILPMLIGAGLTFAGLTGNCGLALLLARAPWNRIEAQSKKTSGTKNSCCP